MCISRCGSFRSAFIGTKARRALTAAVFVAAFAILAVASRTQGNVRDEGYYFDAAEQYSQWYVDLADNLVHGRPQKSFTKAAI